MPAHYPAFAPYLSGPQPKLASPVFPTSPFSLGYGQRRRSSHTPHDSPASGQRATSSVATSGLGSERGRSTYLFSTPDEQRTMSLSRSPSPLQGRGWSTPGVGSSPERGGSHNAYGQSDGAAVSWTTAKERSAKIRGYSASSPRSQGFFSKHIRGLSGTLPRFNGSPVRRFALEDKPQLGWGGSGFTDAIKSFASIMNRPNRRLRRYISILMAFVLAISFFYATRKFRLSPSIA